MTPASIRLLWMATTLSLLFGCSATSKINWSGLILSGRDGWQRPEQVIDALDLRAGQHVAEIGAGDGYWLRRLSEAVGPDGRVYAVEVEQDKVDALRDRVAREGLGNVEVIFGQYDDPVLPDGAIDVAITCLTYHHIDDRSVYFRLLRKDLAPGGRVAHLDDRDDLPIPLRWLPTAGHTSNVTAMDAEMEIAGYRRVASFDFLLVQSFTVYQPDEQSVAARPDLESGS